MHARLLSAILAGLCNTNVKLKSTFPLLSTNRESMVRNETKKNEIIFINYLTVEFLIFMRIHSLS